jgi:hypothetical protein
MKRNRGLTLGRTTRTDPDVCPACGKLNDAATPIGSGNKPGPGDVAVCIGCASVVIYDKDLRLRRPTGREMRQLAKDPRVAVGRAAVREMIRERTK